MRIPSKYVKGEYYGEVATGNTHSFVMERVVSVALHHTIATLTVPSAPG